MVLVDGFRNLAKEEKQRIKQKSIKGRRKTSKVKLNI